MTENPLRAAETTMAASATTTTAMRPMGDKRTRKMLSAAASLILLSGLDRGVVGGAAASNHRGLPQHRVKSARRRVPYPEGHPLGRHLRPRGDDRSEDENFDDENEGSIVGGDGSLHQQRRRRRDQQRQQERRQREHRFLRFWNPSSDPPEPTSRRRRHVQVEEEPESIREGRLTEGRGEMRYWTISGRSLVAPDVLSLNATDGEGSSEQLLVDVEKIVKENVEEIEKEGSRGVNGEGEAGVTDMFDVEQYYLDNAATTEPTELEPPNDEVIEDQKIDFGEAVEEGFNVDQYHLDGQQTEDQDADPESMHETVIQGEEEEEEGEAEAENKERGEDDDERSSSMYQPLRLRAIFTDDITSGSRHLTALQRRILMEDIVNPALFAWSKALRVVPVGGKQGGENDGGNMLVVDQSQLYDGETCGPGKDSGLPSVRVPQEHMTDGVEDADTVVYISVSFADNGDATTSPNEFHLHRGATGPKYNKPTTRRKDGNYSVSEKSMIEDLELEANETSAYPSSAPSEQPSFPPSETEPYVESRPTCPGTYLASATYCSSDQYDRPVAGILSLCISDVHSFFHNPDNVRRSIVTVMHEMGHVLGFNAQSLANFRDPDTGEPLTRRDENGDVRDEKIECTGVRPREMSLVPLPSEDILKFRKVRGGVRVATVVTPTVKRVAQNRFGCGTLIGAELEGGEGQKFGSDGGDLTPGDCLGDHWSRRLFRTDLMNAIVDDAPFSLYISSLTLAYFADSGWYRVDADRVAPPAMWGRNAGCGFAEKTCISQHNGQVSASNRPFFCNNFLEPPPEGGKEKEEEEEVAPEIHGCDLDSSRKAICSLAEYETPIPEEFNYFEKDKYLDHSYHYGGSDPSLEYCPVFEGYSNGHCNDEDSEQLMEVRSSLEVFGEDNSRCVLGRVEKKHTALCLPIACVIQERSLMVKVDGYWKTCSYAGQIMSVWWNPNDYVVCPDPSRMCPTFYCPNDCFREGGICDYQSGQCMCTSVANVTAANTTFWFSNYHSYHRFEPCSGGQVNSPGGTNGTVLVERIDFELPQYYVENTTVLLDDPRDFDDKVSRMFSQLNTGEVVSLVASVMMCAIITYILWSQLVRCYKRRLIGASISKVRTSVGSLSRLLHSASHLSLENDDDTDTPPFHRRPRRGQNGQKDKMVATLLVQLRTEGNTQAQQEQQRRLELGGLAMAEHDKDTSKTNDEHSAQSVAELPSSTGEEALVNRSDLPPLPGGRVLAVVGARIVEDEMEDTRSTTTSVTHTSQSLISSPSRHTEQTEFASPLYQDVDDRRSGAGVRMLRLRRQIE